jgi:hypothetical protein
MVEIEDRAVEVADLVEGHKAEGRVDIKVEGHRVGIGKTNQAG